MDAIDQHILAILQENGRISMKDLAVEVGLSPPSATERVRRLEDRGVIRAFTVELSPEALGYAIQAIVRIRPMPGKLHVVQQLIQDTPGFVECDKVTGDDATSRACSLHRSRRWTASWTVLPTRRKPAPPSSSPSLSSAARPQ